MRLHLKLAAFAGLAGSGGEDAAGAGLAAMAAARPDTRLAVPADASDRGRA